MCALIGGLYMWRGVQARSLRVHQISYEDDVVVIVVGVRKIN